MILFFMRSSLYFVDGDCMEPAVKDKSYLFLNTILPWLRSYRIGDVIAFWYEDKVWVSRIVALENDDIQINEKEVVVNGNLLQDFVERNWSDWQFGNYAVNVTFHVPEKHVYVLSDNLSAHHDDSRVFGAIPHSAILGIF